MWILKKKRNLNDVLNKVFIFLLFIKWFVLWLCFIRKFRMLEWLVVVVKYMDILFFFVLNFGEVLFFVKSFIMFKYFVLVVKWRVV